MAAFPHDSPDGRAGFGAKIYMAFRSRRNQAGLGFIRLAKWLYLGSTIKDQSSGFEGSRPHVIPRPNRALMKPQRSGSLENPPFQDTYCYKLGFGGRRGGGAGAKVHPKPNPENHDIGDTG